MRLALNGEQVETSGAETLAELLRELNIGQELVAVEVNGSIVRKTDYQSFRLSENDKIEIVNFVGGG